MDSLDGEMPAAIGRSASLSRSGVDAVGVGGPDRGG